MDDWAFCFFLVLIRNIGRIFRKDVESSNSELSGNCENSLKVDKTNVYMLGHRLKYMVTEDEI